MTNSRPPAASPQAASPRRVAPVSPRVLSAYYVTALLIIAGLTISSHLIVTDVLYHDRGAASVINTSGKQRMLSQRIAGLAAEYAMGDATARADLLTAIAAFETAHDTLLLDTRTAPQGSAAARALNVFRQGQIASRSNARVQSPGAE